MHWIAHIEGGPKRVNHAAVALGHKIYTFGGYCTGENNLREYTSMDVHVLNTKTYRWTKHPVSDLPYYENDDILPYKRYGHTAVLYEDKIYIWGGRNERASCPVLFCFDTVWHCWTAPECTGDLPYARDGHTAVRWKNKMFIFGGYEDDSDAFAKSVYVLDLDRMHWSCINTGVEPTLRDFHTACCIGDRMYLFGGRGTYAFSGIYLPGDEMYCSHLWYLDLRTYEWHKPVTTGTKPIGRRSHSAFVYEGNMYIFGGYNALEGNHYNDLYEFNPNTNVWKLVIPNNEAPCRRRRQACIIVGNKVFLFGGTSPLPKQEECRLSIEHEQKLVDHSDMYILDFTPTLKTLCIMATRIYKLDESILPYSLKNEFRNMFTPNKITIYRPTNSAG